MNDIRDAVIKSVDFQASDQLVVRHLRSMHTPIALALFSQCYTVFNGCFAGGVASLAGRIHILDHLFQDTEVPIKSCSDFSSTIAAHVFFAAIDEYLDRETQLSVTHRQLAQDFLLGMLTYFQIDPSDFNTSFPIDRDLDYLRVTR